jgi:hypothetical protein
MHQVDDRGNVPIVEDELAVNPRGTIQPAGVENTKGKETPVSNERTSVLSHKRRK